VDGVDDLAAVDSLEVDARNAEVGVPELALDHDERDTFARHLNRVSVPHLVRGESPTHSRASGRTVQLLARG